MHNNTLEGKTVIVTAGNQGGGAIVALRFAARGANVVIIANKEAIENPLVNSTADKIIAAGGKAITLEINLTDAREIQAGVAQIISTFGGIDILINNFSIFNFKRTLETTSQNLIK